MLHEEPRILSVRLSESTARPGRFLQPNVTTVAAKLYPRSLICKAYSDDLTKIYDKLIEF